jgi:YesN/AraC family two-component response regulator
MNILEKLQNDANGISVLYVEDNDDIRLETVRFLKRFFTALDVCKNGIEGLENYKHNKQDIVITDIKMPFMSGLEMSNEIKKLNRKIEIIVTSAFNDSDLLLKAIEIGVHQYILKPVDLSLFAATLLKAIQLVKTEKKVQALYERVQNILNFQDNLVFTVDNSDITACNKAFLNFLVLQVLEI